MNLTAITYEKTTGNLDTVHIQLHSYFKTVLTQKRNKIKIKKETTSKGTVTNRNQDTELVELYPEFQTAST